MKFGQNYYTHQIAEWADAYMDYAALKRICKGSTASTNLQGKRQIEDFVRLLFPRAFHKIHDSDPLKYLELAAQCLGALDTIDQFYCDNYATLLLKLASKSRLHVADYDIHEEFTGQFASYGLDYVELEHQKAACTELIVEFEKLRWYGRVNTDGFQKIIRKVRRSLGTNGVDIAIQIEKTLNRLEFAAQAQCLWVLGNLHKVIASITRAQQNLPKEPPKIQDNFSIRLAKINPSIPALLFFRVIQTGDVLEFEKLIDDACKEHSGFSRTKFLHVLFQCSVGCSDLSWVDVLISRAISQGTIVVIEDWIRKVIAELCWSNSKTQQAKPSNYGTFLSLLTYILDYLLARKIDLLYKQDDLGRIPLHYACECDLADVCGIILKSMKAWEQFDAGNTKSAILLKDKQSRSPIQISVLGSHLEVTKKLIHFESCNNRNDLAALRPCFSAASSELLILAIKSNSTEAVACLLDFDVDVNCCDALGQTPLYLAARSGNETFVSLLLRHKPVIDRPETTKNWTPLIIASLAGFTTIAKILLEHGANIEHRDSAGWTAIDHAGYRGHIPLAKALSKSAADLSHKQAAELQHQFKTSSTRKLLARGHPRRTVSSTESHVVVNLGSLDSSNLTPAISLSPHLIENPSITDPKSLFSLGVSMVGTTNPTFTVPLPLLEDATNNPWIFTTTEPMNAKLVFEIFRYVSPDIQGPELVGRGMALLDNYKRSHATMRESLCRDFTVPIMSTVGLEYIGAVIFSFIISTPLVLPNTPHINIEALWSENGPSKVVGHRGNFIVSYFCSFADISQAWGRIHYPLQDYRLEKIAFRCEAIPKKSCINVDGILQSYVSAVRLGASYVEVSFWAQEKEIMLLINIHSLVSLYYKLLTNNG